MYRDIYLDNSATTQPLSQVLDLMRDVGGNCYGNPSSLHNKGIEAERLMTKAREAVAGCIGAEPREIIFTSGGTEANNLAIKGYLEANPRKGSHIITSSIEHPSVLEVFKQLGTKGYKVDFIGVDRNGRILLEELEQKLCDETALISIMSVNNETGSIQPLKEITAIRDRKNKNTVIHSDAVQAFGKFSLNPAKTGIELMSVSSHKIHGPKGVGALYCSKKIRLKPVLLGGGQESGLRSGTENLPGICGFGLAAEIAGNSIIENIDRVSALNRFFRDSLAVSGFSFETLSGVDASPYILNVSFPGLKAEVLLHHLEEKGIFISIGSACASKKNKRSHVLEAAGIEPAIAEGSVRFSFSTFNTHEDIEAATAALQSIIPLITIRQKGRRGTI
ncbi:MAG: cysteine desulfurase [Clostridiales bacterium]|nr:cysteine desulfurase [Clostridiales bacterium]